MRGTTSNCLENLQLVRVDRRACFSKNVNEFLRPVCFPQTAKHRAAEGKIPNRLWDPLPTWPLLLAGLLRACGGGNSSGHFSRFRAEDFGEGDTDRLVLGAASSASSGDDRSVPAERTEAGMPAVSLELIP